MDKRPHGSKDKLASGLLRGAAVSGLATGLVAAATLGGVGTANASCLSIGGFFSIGSGCTSTPLSFAVVLGNGTANAGGLLTGAVAIGNATFADAQGFLTGAIANGLGNTAPGPFPPQTDVRSAGALSLAYGGGTNTLVRTEGILNIAAGQGDNFIVRAGGTPSDIGNVALSLGNHTPSEPGDLAAVVAGDIAPGGRNPSFFNLALNLGNDSNVQARGFANSVLNIFGNGNSLSAIGVVNNATNIFGDDNIAIAANVPTANILQRIGGNVAFTAFGNGNTVRAGSEIAPPDGPLAIAGALGVDNRTISQPGTGITIATPFNDTGIPTTVLAASSTQGNRVGLNSTGSNTDELAASSTQGNRVGTGLNAASNRPETTSLGGSLRESVSKKFSDPASSSSGSSRGTSSSNGDSSNGDSSNGDSSNGGNCSNGGSSSRGTSSSSNSGSGGSGSSSNGDK